MPEARRHPPARLLGAGGGSLVDSALSVQVSRTATGKPRVANRVAAPSWHALIKPAIAVWALQRFLALPVTVVAALVAHAGLAPQALLTRWAEWDANWYLAIAQHGYFKASTTAFFPLFPALIAALGTVLGGNTLLAALLLANGASLLALLGIGLLARHEDGTINAGTRAMLAMSAYPVAFFLIAPYADDLLLASAIFAIYFARRGRWRWVVVCGLLAGLSRPTSIALVVPLAWEYGRQHGWWQAAVWRHLVSRLRLLPREAGGAALVVGCVPAAAGAYVLYLTARYGDPTLYSQAQYATWHLVTLPFWQTLLLMARSALHPPTDTLFRVIMVVDYAAFFGAAASTVLWARRLPLVYTLYSAALLILLLCSPIPSRPEVITSSARHVLTAFPIFLAASRWMLGRPRLAIALLLAGCALQVAFMGWFLTGHWIE